MLPVWLVVECWLLRTVISLRYFYAANAALLIARGPILWYEQNQRSAA